MSEQIACAANGWPFPQKASEIERKFIAAAAPINAEFKARIATALDGMAHARAEKEAIVETLRLATCRLSLAEGKYRNVITDLNAWRDSLAAPIAPVQPTDPDV